MNDVKIALRESGAFNKVNVVIDTSSEYAKSSPHGVQVLFELDEKRLSLSTNTGMDIDKARVFVLQLLKDWKLQRNI